MLDGSIVRVLCGSVVYSGCSFPNHKTFDMCALWLSCGLPAVEQVKLEGREWAVYGEESSGSELKLVLVKE
jgi:hypothetical protein